MKIYDCFTFFNELDLLEFRLKLLDKYVDYFVIAESNITHSGKEKEYFFETNKNRFVRWQHKIIHLPLTQTTEGIEFGENETRYNKENGSWKLENEHRNALHSIASRLNPDDLVIISDLDEIPNPNIFKGITAPKSPVVLSMLFHYYFMNCQHSGHERWWNGSILSSGEYFKTHTPQELRDMRDAGLPSLKKAGWHFSYLGGLEKIKYKLQSFAHTEFNKTEYLDEKNILAALQKGKDLLRRKGTHFRFVPIHKYPRELSALIAAYPLFISKVPLKSKIYSLFKRYDSLK